MRETLKKTARQLETLQQSAKAGGADMLAFKLALDRDLAAHEPD